MNRHCHSESWLALLWLDPINVIVVLNRHCHSEGSEESYPPH